MITLCTLFDHNYLDKGLAMYESLDKVCEEFELYVLAMSDLCYDILIDLSYTHLKPIKLSEFEDEELLRVKSVRNVGEYCWTCSSSLIRYVLQNYKPEYCTYIDADLYFYSDPKVIIDEMKQRNASAQVIGHRFPKGQEHQSEKVGKYCVEFNTFKNDYNGLSLVNHWRTLCLGHCSIDGDGVYWGDQKYQDSWCEDYDFCIETENYGAGIAPWNYSDYTFVRMDGNIPVVKYRERECKMIFYHFENLIYLDKTHIKINIYNRWGVSSSLAKVIYPDYLRVVDRYKDIIKEKYGLSILLTSHPAMLPNRITLSYILKKIPTLFSKKMVDFLNAYILAKICSKKSIIDIS